MATIIRFCCILLSILVLRPAILFSQSQVNKIKYYSRGFIVENNGDSVIGFVEDPQDRFTLHKSIGFKTNKYFEKRDFTPYEISGFGNIKGSERYSSVEVPTLNGSDLTFVRFLIDGSYDIFYYQLMGTDHVLIRDPMNRIYDVTNPPELFLGKDQSGNMTMEKFKELLKKVFVENPDILIETDRVKPTRSSIINLIINYYNINNKPYIAYGIKQSSFVAGFTGGVALDKYLFKVAGKSVNSNSTPSPFLGINFLSSNINSGVGLILESIIAAKTFHYSYDSEDANSREFNEVVLRSYANTTRLGLNFVSLKKSKSKPFIEGGGQISGLFSSRSDNYKDILRKSDNMVFSYLNHDVLSSSVYYGVFIRAGSNIDLRNNKGLRISGGYSTVRANNSEIIRSFDLSASYYLRIK